MTFLKNTPTLGEAMDTMGVTPKMVIGNTMKSKMN